jgi:subtilisin-like proprotein convertase family protein
MASTTRTLCPAAALIALAIVALAPAGASAKVKTFSSGNVGLQIPEPLGAEAFPASSGMRIKTKGRIKDVNVAVRITIPDSRDLELSVVGPSFKGSTLKENGFLNSPKGPDFGAGAPTCGGTPTVFDSEAPTPILQGLPPFTGSFSPVTSLSGFRGGRLQGKWSLEVLDHFTGSIDEATGSPGVLDCWQLTVRYKPKKRK